MCVYIFLTRPGFCWQKINTTDMYNPPAYLVHSNWATDIANCFCFMSVYSRLYESLSFFVFYSIIFFSFISSTTLKTGSLFTWWTSVVKCNTRSVLLGLLGFSDSLCLSWYIGLVLTITNNQSSLSEGGCYCGWRQYISNLCSRSGLFLFYKPHSDFPCVAAATSLSKENSHLLKGQTSRHTHKRHWASLDQMSESYVSSVSMCMNGLDFRLIQRLQAFPATLKDFSADLQRHWFVRKTMYHLSQTWCDICDQPTDT